MPKKKQTEEIEKRHKTFVKVMEERLSIEDIRTEFINLKKLKDIDSKLDELKDIEERIENLSSLMLAANEIKDSVKQAVNPIKKELVEIKVELSKKNEEKTSGMFGNIFGGRK